MSFEEGHELETDKQADPVVHLADQDVRYYPHLVDYRSLASNILPALVDYRVDGFVLTDDPHVLRRLDSLKQFIGASARGLITPGETFNGLTPIAIRRGIDFKAITGLDDKMAKAWAGKASEVLVETVSSRDLCEETSAFLQSDIEVFVERLIRQPMRYTSDI